MDKEYFNKFQSIIESKENLSSQEYFQKIKESKSPEIMAFMSESRSNVVSFLPIKETDRVLEVNSHFGELSEFLSKHSALFYSVVFSEEEKNIVKKRCEANTEVFIGERLFSKEMLPSDYHDFDFVIYTVSEDLNPNELYENISILKGLLSGNGLLILISDNRLGISKWISCPLSEISSGTDRVTSRILKNDRIGFSKDELDEVTKRFSDFQRKVYYPYPNRIFASDIFTDKFLPKEGISFTSGTNFFDDIIEYHFRPRAVDTVIEEGIFPVFSDSFIYILGKELPDDIKNLDYVHYSDRRNKNLRTVTKINSEKDRGFEVMKECFDSHSEEFVSSLEHKYQMLSNSYSETNIIFNAAEKISAGQVRLQYISLPSFDSILDELIFDDKKQEVLDRISRYFKLLKSSDGVKAFTKTEEFSEVFGNTIDFDDVSLEYSDIDAIFSNAFIHDDGSIEIADFEWTFDFPIPFRFIEFRCLHYYLNFRESRSEYLGDEIYKYFGISDEERDAFLAMEEAFQHYTAGDDVILIQPEFYYRTIPFRDEYKRLSDVEEASFLRDVHINQLASIMDGQKKEIDALGAEKKNIENERDDFKKMAEDFLREREEEKRQKELRDKIAHQVNIYFDRGDGFTDADKIIIDPELHSEGNDAIEITFEIDDDVKKFRIDPATEAGVFELKLLSDGKGKRLSPKFINMKKIDSNTWFCINNDPQMIVKAGFSDRHFTMDYSYKLLL